MIELKFETEEETNLAVNKLSPFGKIEAVKKVETEILEKIYLISNYKDALFILNQASDEDVNDYSINALELIKNLFESEKLVNYTKLDQTQLEDILHNIAAKTKNDKYLEYLTKREIFNKEVNKFWLCRNPFFS